MRPAQPPRQVVANNPNDRQQERQEWQARKRQRDEEKKTRTSKDGNGDDENDEQLTTEVKTKRRRIDPNEGYYHVSVVGDGGGGDVATRTRTYLEGDIYYGILEEDMPVQLWTGPTLATREEKRLLDRTHLWRNALILAIQHPKTQTDRAPANVNGEIEKEEDGWTVHATYLKAPNDEVETIEKNIPVSRVRIQLGGDDERIPETLEEARLLAMGGEEEYVVVKTNGTSTTTTNDPAGTSGRRQKDGDVEEATGLSAWKTVSIRKTTARQQDREERDRLVDQRRQARMQLEAEAKRTEARRMEEAKVANADDSALGAFDVWGRGDYKGIDISKEATLSVEETAKKLAPPASAGSSSNGGKVTFRKAKNRACAASRRKTSADDD
jgi:hypothetical protein